MLGQLGSFRRRCQRATQSLSLRGIATQKQGRRQQDAPPPRRQQDAPPPRRDTSEKIEWWAVDGELFKAEKFDPKRVLSPLENEHISNRRRRRELMKHMSQARLKLKLHNQDSYWAAYMRRFQILRDEWEKHVWDPIPVPQPKRRHPTWLAEETQKYVWQDPRREAYQSGAADRNAAKDSQRNAYTFDLSRMDQSAIKSRFDEKIGYKGQGMGHSPYENQRNPGTSSVRPGMTPSRQRNVDARRHIRQPDFEDFDDVFGGSNTSSRRADAKASASTRNQVDSEVNRSETDSEEGSGYEAAAGNEGAMFNWSETDSSEEEDGYEAAAGEEEDDEDDDHGHSVECESERKDNQRKRQGWYGHEDDLFKDDE